jgi:hypothetical protein
MSRRAWSQAFGGTTPAIKPFGSDSAVVRDVRKATRPMEDDEQMAVIEWASNFVYFDGVPLSEYIHHSPNGGKRETKTNAAGQTYCPEGIRLKKMGTKAGFPDLTVFLARGGYFGLYIEMKRERGGTTSREQRQLIERLERQGYLCAVCHGTLEAVKVLKTYMSFPSTITKKMEFNCNA